MEHSNENGQLEQVSSIKLLGVYIDNNLTWSSQVQYLVNKLSSKVGVMCRLSKVLSKELLNIVYLTIFQPHIDYCLTLWGSCPTSYLSSLQRLQNRAARCITQNYDWSIRGLDLVHEIKWFNVKQHLLGTLMFKITNGLAPKYLCDSFQYVSDIHSRNTRSSCNNKLTSQNLLCHLSNDHRNKVVPSYGIRISYF